MGLPLYRPKNRELGFVSGFGRLSFELRSWYRAGLRHSTQPVPISAQELGCQLLIHIV
jgi:hypothetical protein